ncbi:hypothetical protein EJ02DRAFT_335488 [Clathrospora elynae]|uniref:Mid2 domain-containing protein n=1 Tax=Clathrospora elynae TaxID=706981 RepID=A0A6A5TCF0_9PLEO|nr:hypothetical protein EJ02DRAFT_335488 [Clathrospora elynae]
MFIPCVFIFSILVLPALSSKIATFTDDKCKDSHISINAENGYPNGTCSLINAQGAFGSFQVVGLDPGCSATIYGTDDTPYTPCSSTTLQFANIGQCYNTSFVYYSIDACTPPSQLSSPSPSVQATSKRTNTGAIAGGVVGGVCGLAFVAGVIFLVLRRSRKRRQHQPAALHEAPESTPTELPPGDVKHELYSPEAAPQEMGRNSVHIPAAELQGDDVSGQGIANFHDLGDTKH